MRKIAPNDSIIAEASSGSRASECSPVCQNNTSKHSVREGHRNHTHRWIVCVLRRDKLPPRRDKLLVCGGETSCRPGETSCWCVAERKVAAERQAAVDSQVQIQIQPHSRESSGRSEPNVATNSADTHRKVRGN